VPTVHPNYTQPHTLFHQCLYTCNYTVLANGQPVTGDCTLDCVYVCAAHWNVGIFAWLWRRFTTDLPAGVSEMNQRLVEEAEAGDLPFGSQV